MPLSQPWSAPEHARINQQWTPAEAKKMDLFSYGVFSLWVLFRDRLSEATLAENGDPSSSRRPPVYSDQDQAISTLMRAKERKELPLLAQQLLEAEPSLDIKWKKRLRKLFDSILNHNPNQRDLARFPLPTDRIPQMDLNVSDTGFKVLLKESNRFHLLMKVRLKSLSSNSTGEITGFARILWPVSNNCTTGHLKIQRSDLQQTLLSN